MHTQDEEHFQQLAQSVNDVFWIYEPQSARFLYVSPAYEREGQDRWIAERASPIARKTGQAMRIAGVSHDITAHKNVDLALVRSGRHKDEFLAMLAHELRNPLAPIRLAVALLARQHADRPAVEQKAIFVIDRRGGLGIGLSAAQPCRAAGRHRAQAPPRCARGGVRPPPGRARRPRNADGSCLDERRSAAERDQAALS